MRRSTGSWPTSSTRRWPRGLDEPDGCVVPAHRGAEQPDAHRRCQHLRGAVAAVRGARADGRVEARAGAALPAEGALRATRLRRLGQLRRHGVLTAGVKRAMKEL